LWISTFHAFCKRILDSHAIEIGLPVNFKLLTETEQWVMIRKNLGRFDLDYFKPIGNPSRFIRVLLKHFSRAKDELISPEEYVKYAKESALDFDNDLGLQNPKNATEDFSLPREADKSADYNEKHGSLKAPATLEHDGVRLEAQKIQEAANAYAIYQKLLIESEALDFGDLITYCYELFKKRPNILARYKKQFKYILVDEFQDTNYAQYELVKQLGGKDGNITVVGDDDQSVYKFRGASVSNILKFKEDYKIAKQIALTRNYRSLQNLLDLSYEFIQLNNPDRLEKKLNISKKLLAQTNEKAEIRAIKYPDFFQEAQGVVEKIATIKKQDKDCDWDDFAILVRSNESAEIFIDLLDRSGLPYIHLSRRGLYKKSIVQQVLAYLKLLDNYYESRSVYRVLNLPVFNLSDDDLAEIVAYSNRKAQSLFGGLKQIALQKSLSESGQKSVNLLLSLVEKHTKLSRNKPVNELFVAVVRDLKIAHEESERGPETALEVQNLSYLNQFHRKIQDFIVGSDQKLLKNFMEEVDLELMSGETGKLEFDPDIGPETIKLITIHSAKGLEFKYVFVVALVDKRFPSISRSEPIELPDKLVKDILPSGDFHIQEERRLFYVAMTRAKKDLFLTYALDYGGSTVRKPSVFLKDLKLIKNELPGPTGKVDFGKKKMPEIFSDGSAETRKGKLVLPKTFSFTSISDFRKCPLEFKYRHILKVPRPGAAALSFGQTVHNSLENYLKLYMQELSTSQGDLFTKSKKQKKSSVPPFSKLKEFYEKGWIDDWYESFEQKEDYKKLGSKIIKNIFKYFEKNIPAPKIIEKKFRLGVGKYVFTGKIDRADQTPEGLVIIDYKTGSAKDRPLGKVDKEQLLVYQWAAEDFLREKVADLQYWFLRDGIEKKSFLGTAKQVSEVKEKLLETITQIVDAVENNNFHKYHKKHQDCEYG